VGVIHGQITRLILPWKKLDRSLMNVDWEVMFPLTTVHNLSRDVSEHNPIILDKMEVGDRKPKCLKF
jgi:hypothetical protein